MARGHRHPLARYIGIRLLVSVILLFGVTLVTFALTHLVPADPVQAQLGEQASGDPEIVQAFRERQGLDKPVPVQYAIYLGHLVRGNLGTSNVTQIPVRTELSRAFPATAELAIAAIVVSVILGIGLGLWAALRRQRLADQVIRLFSLAGVSAPTFWLALVAYYTLFYKLGLLPGSGRLSPEAVPPKQVTGFMTIDSLLAGNLPLFWDALAHLVLPASVLALFTIGLLTRFCRSAILEVLDLDYVRAARAKGLPRRTVVLRYVLRGAFVPIVTVVGLAFGSLLSGTVLTEKIFAWHGLGEYAFNGATKLDLPAVMGVSIVVGVVYIGINLVVDVIYGVIDPRVRIT